MKLKEVIELKTLIDLYADSKSNLKKTYRKKIHETLEGFVEKTDFEKLCNKPGCFNEKSIRKPDDGRCEKHKGLTVAQISRRYRAMARPEDHFECLDCGEFMSAFLSGVSRKLVETCKYCNSPNIDDVIR